MTNVNADSANNTLLSEASAASNKPAKQPRPVSEFENKEVNFMARCAEGVHKMNMEKIDALRTQQKDYLESLPAKPRKAISAIHRLIDDEYTDQGLVRAEHAMLLVEQVIRYCDIDGYPALIDALAWAAEEATDEVRAFRARRDRAVDICCKVKGIR